jgi:CMP-N,N'-diacetyllegionaminic acid synthase
VLFWAAKRMFDGRRVLAVVPARGGSKGVPLKNIHPLRGKPLIAHTSELIATLGWIDRAVVSTDSDEIARVAEAHGLAAPFRRPADLSGDRVGDVPVLAHALHTCEALDGVEYDVVLMLQPTSPLRRPQDVEKTMATLVAEKRDSVWTVSPTDLKYHPLKQLTLCDGRLKLHDAAGASVVARQELAPVYHRNGAAYAVTRACLLDRGLLGIDTGAVVIDAAAMLSIDTLADFLVAEEALAEREAQRSAVGPRTIVVDIDGVIATIVSDNDYAKAAPLHDNIARVNALHDAGHHVVLFTARGSKTGIDWAETTRDQMAEWGVHYNELHFGKPAADYYIDDRMTTLARAVAEFGPGTGGGKT